MTPDSSLDLSESSPASDRRAALHRYEVLDPSPEEAFDRITRLAAHLFDAPMALIRLVAEDRQWFKSTIGLDRRETEIDLSFCVHALDSNEVVVIEDTTTDERIVPPPPDAGISDIRFVASAPLVTPDGYQIGTLCVLDTEPRHPTDETLSQLEDLAAMVIDELELRRENMERRRAERRHRNFLEKSPVGIYRVASNGVLRFANAALVEMLGFESAEALATRTRKVGGFARSDEQAFETQLKTDGSVRQWETTWRGADGREITVLESARVVKERDDLTVYEGIVEDVTEQKQAEQELARSRKRWRQLVENQRDAIHISVDGAIQYVNPAAVDLMGATSQDDVIGRPLHAFMTSEAAKARLTDRLEQIRRGEAVPPTELEIERLDGERRIVESYAVPVEYKGERAAQGVIRDLTERKRTQRQLRQAQKMKTVGTLAGGVAHDFTNIIHAVKAYVRLVQDDLPTDDPSQPLLDQASKGLDRAEGLVEKLLTFSRQETSSQRVRVSLGDIVRESIDLVTPSLPKKLTVRTNLDAQCTTLGDPGELHQVATNIMTNAAQAMAKQPDAQESVLDVDVRPIDVDEDLARRHLNLDPGRYVCLSISDTGPGMDAETQERIFEPFYTTKDVGEGTGLGLSVVHGIVQSHSGEIAVYSEPGEGTTFDVYLPYEAGENETRAEQAPGEDIGEAGGHILFVDDDAKIIELEAVRLRRLGYQVTTSTSALTALQEFDQSPSAFDLVLTDYSMPDMNGLDLTRELRARDYERPIVLLSGFSAQVSPVEMQEAGVTTFLRKPVGSDELKHTLNHLG